MYVMGQEIQQVINGDLIAMTDQMKKWNFVVLEDQNLIVILLLYVHQHLNVLMANFNVLIKVVLVYQKNVMEIQIALTDLMKDHSVM
jgi:hypothetical protein